MIQCVGPGEKFCSRLCCSTGLKNALKIKELDPQAEVTILYRRLREEDKDNDKGTGKGKR